MTTNLTDTLAFFCNHILLVFGHNNAFADVLIQKQHCNSSFYKYIIWKNIQLTSLSKNIVILVS